MNPRQPGPRDNRQYEYDSPEASAPAAKSRETARAAARRGDAAHQADVLPSSKTHPVKQTGSRGSYALQDLPEWDDTTQAGPEPMHCGGGEARSFFDMAVGGTGKRPAYSRKALPCLAQWECKCNKRFHMLQGIDPGDTSVHGQKSS